MPYILKYPFLLFFIFFLIINCKTAVSQSNMLLTRVESIKESPENIKNLINTTRQNFSTCKHMPDNSVCKAHNYLILGYLYEQNFFFNQDSAKHYYNKANNIAIDNVDILNDLLGVHIEMSNYLEAIRLLKIAIDIDSKNAQIYKLILAIQFIKSGNLKLGLKAYNEAYKYFPIDSALVYKFVDYYKIVSSIRNDSLLLQISDSLFRRGEYKAASLGFKVLIFTARDSLPELADSALVFWVETIAKRHKTFLHEIPKHKWNKNAFQELIVLTNLENLDYDSLRFWTKSPFRRHTIATLLSAKADRYFIKKKLKEAFFYYKAAYEISPEYLEYAKGILRNRRVIKFDIALELVQLFHRDNNLEDEQLDFKILVDQSFSENALKNMPYNLSRDYIMHTKLGMIFFEQLRYQESKFHLSLALKKADTLKKQNSFISKFLPKLKHTYAIVIDSLSREIPIINKLTQTQSYPIAKDKFTLSYSSLPRKPIDLSKGNLILRDKRELYSRLEFLNPNVTLKWKLKSQIDTLRNRKISKDSLAKHLSNLLYVYMVDSIGRGLKPKKLQVETNVSHEKEKIKIGQKADTEASKNFKLYNNIQINSQIDTIISKQIKGNFIKPITLFGGADIFPPSLVNSQNKGSFIRNFGVNLLFTRVGLGYSMTGLSNDPIPGEEFQNNINQLRISQFRRPNSFDTVRSNLSSMKFTVFWSFWNRKYERLDSWFHRTMYHIYLNGGIDITKGIVYEVHTGDLGNQFVHFPELSSEKFVFRFEDRYRAQHLHVGLTYINNFSHFGLGYTFYERHPLKFFPITFRFGINYPFSVLEGFKSNGTFTNKTITLLENFKPNINLAATIENKKKFKRYNRKLNRITQNYPVEKVPFIDVARNQRIINGFDIEKSKINNYELKYLNSIIWGYRILLKEKLKSKPVVHDSILNKALIDFKKDFEQFFQNLGNKLGINSNLLIKDYYASAGSSSIVLDSPENSENNRTQKKKPPHYLVKVFADAANNSKITYTVYYCPAYYEHLLYKIPAMFRGVEEFGWPLSPTFSFENFGPTFNNLMVWIGDRDNQYSSYRHLNKQHFSTKIYADDDNAYVKDGINDQDPAIQRAFIQVVKSLTTNPYSGFYLQTKILKINNNYNER